MDRKVVIYNGYETLQVIEDEVVSMFNALEELDEYAISAGELSIAFLDNETLRIMHGEFLQDPQVTDVITFPGDRAEDFAGEICVSVDYAMEYAENQTSSFSHELTLYLVHGWLHLAGLDDRTPEDAQKMRDAEAQLLAFLDGRNCCPTFSLASRFSV